MKYEITIKCEYDDDKIITDQNSIIKGMVLSACPLTLGFRHPGCHFAKCSDCWAVAIKDMIDRGQYGDKQNYVHVERLD